MKLNISNLKYTALVGKTISNQYKPFAIPGIAIVISIIVLLLVFKPKLDTILTLKEQIKQDKQKLEAIKSKATELSALDPVSLEENLKLINRALPFEKDVPSAIIGIERLAADSGLVIDTLAISPGGVSTDSAKIDPSTELEIKLTMRGPFTAIKAYARRVRESLRVFGIKDAVVGVSSGEDSARLSIATTMIVYFSPLPKDRGNIETPLPKLNDEEKELINKVANYQFVSIVPQATGGSKPDPFSR